MATTGALLLWGIAAPWEWAPSWLFGAAVGTALAGVVFTALRWRTLGWLPLLRRPLASIALVLGSMRCVAMAVIAVAMAVLAQSR